MAEKIRDNYLLARDRAQAYFLKLPQEELLTNPCLRWDERLFYVEFLGRPYTICRKTGDIRRAWSEEQAGFEETLSIFDLLFHRGQKALSGFLAPVNSLKGRPASAGVSTDFFSSTAAEFDRNPEAFQKACLKLGGQPENLADAAYRFPIFGELQAVLKFYYSDEEFPASLTVLWDENTLNYLLYETVFYVEGFLLHSIIEEMKEEGGAEV